MAVITLDDHVGSRVTVRGSYVRSDGTYPSGYVAFIPMKTLFDAQARLTVLPVPVRAPLVNGAFETTVEASTDINLTPSQFVYRVEEHFTGGRNFYAAFPYGSPPIDFAEVIPYSTPGQASQLYPSLAAFFALMKKIAELQAIIDGGLSTDIFKLDDIFPLTDAFV